jgi:hypothetical protein
MAYGHEWLFVSGLGRVRSTERARDKWVFFVDAGKTARAKTRLYRFTHSYPCIHAVGFIKFLGKKQRRGIEEWFNKKLRENVKRNLNCG